MPKSIVKNSHHIGRFAPSPTGRMHLGNVYAALMSWLFARASGGLWLLRIEDLDPERSRQEYADALMSDLEWLGLEWDGTPLYQSQRTDIYRHYFEQLTQQGLVYPCFCTRADILATQAPHQSDNRVVYSGACRGLTYDQIRQRMAERKPSWRLMMPDAESSYVDAIYGPQRCNLKRDCGDIVIRRADGAFAYQLAVSVDDALSGVTQVVRGRDLILSAHQQIAICGMLSLKPPEYAHVPLLINENAQRLSKRDNSLNIGVLREKFSPQQLIGILAYKTGLKDDCEPVTPQELIKTFNTCSIKPKDILMTI
ncbi:MAG: tRNA glutamyl-Q(34) synthetase GluQRS [Paludibacteraceae bacterium]|nr:tRNA glutamyl-Q(34) synthetase GluQRS [Paludibacteraceae bacterium]